MQAEALKITLGTWNTTHTLAIVRVRLVHRTHMPCALVTFGISWLVDLSLPFRERLQNTKKSYTVAVISMNEDLVELNYSYISTP